MSRLHELLRLRPLPLATPPGVIERALARCARSTRMSGQLGSVGAGSGTRATTPIETLVLDEPAPPAPAPPIADPAASAPESAAVTVPSLNQAPPAPPPREGLAAGRIIAGYRIEGLLGKGGMGSVYRATQLSMGRQVAFKVLANRLGADPAFVNRFKREARAAGRLHHPNLITVHDWGEADGHIFFSMELVEGRSLKDVQKERGRLPVDEVLRLARQVLEALRYAHGKGVVHRDIKPDNVMLDAHGSVKLADLGLSRVQIEESHDTTDLFQTEAGSFMGTPHYMPPEQGRDAHAADARSDLYSLGATCFHLLTGRTPFTGATPMEVLVAAQTQPLAWGETPPPRAVQAFIERLMAKEPGQRPQSAAEALVGLGDLAAPAQAASAAPRRARWRWWLAGTVAGALIAGGGLVALGQQQRKRAFEHQVAEAQAAAAAHRYPAAIEQLKRLRAATEDDKPRAARLDQLAADTAAAWDAWALAGLEPVATEVRRLIAAHQYEDGLKRLQDVPDDRLSPAATAQVERLQGELLTAATAAATATRPAADHPGAQRLERFFEQRRGITEEVAQRSSFKPPEQVALRDGALVFSGRGSGRVPLAALMAGGRGAVVLHLAWLGTPSPDARWELSFGPGHAIGIGPDGAYRMTPEGRTALPYGPKGLFLPVLEHQLRQVQGRDAVCTWSMPEGAALAFDLGRPEGFGRRGPLR